MKAFVTGAAGFIGSNLVDRLLARGDAVVGYDNLSTGQARFLEPARRSEGFKFVLGDVLDGETLTGAMAGADAVFHLSANADVRFGLDHPERDLEQNTVGTFRVLEAMRRTGVRRIAFTSTGSVYGDAVVMPTPENHPFPSQTSLYGASKLAGEALVQAYCEGYGMEGFVFRFVSILGPRYTHGHVFDFCRSLLADPASITVLGDGRQRKSYLHVEDCVEAVLWAVDRGAEKCAVYNLGTDEYCTPDQSLGWICGRMGLSPQVRHTGGARGWIGDNPFIWLECGRMRSTGWRPRRTIREGVLSTVDWLLANEWVFEARGVR